MNNSDVGTDGVSSTHFEQQPSENRTASKGGQSERSATIKWPGALGYLRVEEISDKQLYFPPTRYYGSKRRLLKWLGTAFSGLEFTTVLDPFGGTGSVSLLLQYMGKTVTFHDSLSFNYFSAKALLSKKKMPLSIDEFEKLTRSIKPHKGFVSETFHGIFYPENENKWLDGALHVFHQIQDQDLRHIFLYCLCQASLKKRPFNLFHRANLNLRERKNISRTFGNYTTWTKPFDEHMLASFRDVSITRAQIKGQVKILKPASIFDLSSGYDLVYLDPPYLGASKAPESYISRYHFLEGLARYKD